MWFLFVYGHAGSDALKAIQISVARVTQPDVLLPVVVQCVCVCCLRSQLSIQLYSGISTHNM